MRILLLTAVVTAFDQWSKYAVKNNFIENIPTEIIGNFLRFTYCQNDGLAFGLPAGNFFSIVTFASIFASFLILYFLFLERRNHLLIRSGLALILAGALGNIIDRLFVIFKPENYRGVVDFIDVGFGANRWYIFNVADSAITVGISLYFIHSLFIRTK